MSEDPEATSPETLTPEEERCLQLREGFTREFSTLCETNDRFADTADLSRDISRSVGTALLDKHLQELAAADEKSFDELSPKEQLAYVERMEWDMRNVYALETGGYGRNYRGRNTPSPSYAYLNGDVNHDLQQALEERTNNVSGIKTSRILPDMVFFRQLLGASSLDYGTVDNWEHTLSLTTRHGGEEAEVAYLQKHADILSLVEQGVAFANDPRLGALTTDTMFKSKANPNLYGSGVTAYQKLFEKMDDVGISRDPEAPIVQELQQSLEKDLGKLRDKKVNEIVRKLDAINLDAERPGLVNDLAEVEARLQEIETEYPAALREKQNQEAILRDAGLTSFKIKGNARSEITRCHNLVNALAEEKQNLEVWKEALEHVSATNRELSHNNPLVQARNTYTPTNPQVHPAGDEEKLLEVRKTLESVEIRDQGV